MPLKALTANRLVDGVVVFLADGGRWSERIGAALVADDEAAAAALAHAGSAAEAERLVVGAYLIEVEPEGDGIRPARLRERIRADGPTVIEIPESPARREA